MPPATPTAGVGETAVPTPLTTEAAIDPKATVDSMSTAEIEPTPTLALTLPPSSVTATATGEAILIPEGDPCGVVLPVFSEEVEPETTELPEVDIPDSVPEAAIPALERLLAAPGTVGLTAYQIGYEANGVYLNADVPMPLASVVKVINLIAYAEGASGGRFNTADWVPLEEMERYYLPGTDLGSHRLGLEDLADRNLVAFEPPATPLEEVPWLMMRFSSNAASDYLQMAVGQRTLEETAVSLGLTTQTAPCPFIGHFLMMSNHERPGNDQLAIEAYLDRPDEFGHDVIALTELFASDEEFRQDELNLRGRSPSLAVQRFYSENFLSRASANEYADLMARIFNNGLSSGFANIVVRRNLEWPMIFETNQEVFTAVGYKNGAFPGILTTVYYAQRREDGARMVVALFYRELPETLYRDWRRNLPHDEFARWLLADPEAIPILNNLLGQ